MVSMTLKVELYLVGHQTDSLCCAIDLKPSSSSSSGATSKSYRIKSSLNGNISLAVTLRIDTLEAMILSKLLQVEHEMFEELTRGVL